MKKFLIALIMIISIGSLYINVKAFDLIYSSIEYTDVFGYHSFGTAVGFEIDYYDIPHEVEYIYNITIDIGDADTNPLNEFTSGGIDSTLIIADTDENVLYQIDLVDLYTSSNPYGVITILKETQQIITNDRIIFMGLSEPDKASIDKIYMRVMQNTSFTGTPESWINDSHFKVSVLGYYINYFYYNGSYYNKLYERDFISGIPVAPEDPTFMPTADSSFLGWKTILGEYYNFIDPITSDMLVDGELYLYATYLGINEPVIEEEVDLNAPTGLNSILSIINMDNPEGYILVFLFLHLIIIIGLLLLKANSFAIIATSMSLYALFIFFGMLPIYFIIILGLIYTIIIIKTFKSNGGATE